MSQQIAASPQFSIVEVGPRDGLQNHAREIDTAAKIGFIEALANAGLRCIETTSFVSPKAVPKMADAFDVMTGVSRRPGVRYMALVPNERGLDRAIEAGVDSIGLFAAATEAFSRANLNASIDETFERFATVVAKAAPAGMWIRGYISVAFHCPYSGVVAVPDAVAVAERLHALGCDEIVLADTTGQAAPEQVRSLVASTQTAIPIDRMALHFHDTRGLAIENVEAGFEGGVRIFDGSAGGIGGCPFSPGAPGNVATEAVVRFFEARGIDTGIDAEAVERAFQTWIGNDT